ncbi:AraC family transcriptional regulator [Acidisoma cellulosilytica]|uniref:AraC family transcriptional regulator n=1 Tax=Acidisoma cellulosilyticum TaxID=2802395 RepID=A0A963YX52_9PROT|nr:AraC family transcriptional regulator [Acidisoma cellulosilyticum]MCB8878734.1 AraC family transcriptional regulator [Acidisoma cellulosilyticum]
MDPMSFMQPVLARMSAIARRQLDSGAQMTGIPRFEITHSTKPTEPFSFVFEPVCCLILQGAKRVIIGDRALRYGAGDYFLGSLELPALAQIVEASPEEPYLALNLSLDPSVIATVLFKLPSEQTPALAQGFSVGCSDPDLIDTWYRMLRTMDRPLEIPVLAPLIESELLFRMLNGPHGAVLRQVAGTDRRLSQIRRSLTWIRENYARPIRVEQLAERVGMSGTVFHRHFKAVCATIRLHEARRHLLKDSGDIAGAAFAVGYESASQFTREYARLFGEPPRRDIRRLILESSGEDMHPS